MQKGMFTQGAVVLLNGETSLDEIASMLPDIEIVGRQEAEEDWVFGGDTLLVAYRPEVNGLIVIDWVNRTWPDHMGDPENEPMIMGAWSMGHFGPFAFPGGLARAGEQSWGWEPGHTIAEQHTGFLRIRSSYAFGAAENDPIIPKEYQPLPELEFITKLAIALLDLPNALCYYNPNGEVLCDKETLRESLNHAAKNDFPPLDAWSNVRLFNINEEWVLMDTVGNDQLDFKDCEACFSVEAFDPAEVANFLRNSSLYLHKNTKVIKDGDSMDGPGEQNWQATNIESSVCDPPREVLRWLPESANPPDDVTEVLNH